jgi:hypothetical protein
MIGVTFGAGTDLPSRAAECVGLNSVCREIVSYVTIVFHDKVRGQNKAQR